MANLSAPAAILFLLPIGTSPECRAFEGYSPQLLWPIRFEGYPPGLTLEEQRGPLEGKQPAHLWFGYTNSDCPRSWSLVTALGLKEHKWPPLRIHIQLFDV
ncbi:hypothetical protein VNO77_18882 [Canavalia gladiata]|uniref:Uncharacterized protein n=1 Tax=Canavalia gladiata TaxID=3824 RepID=A0AAN9LQC0_CANGL